MNLVLNENKNKDENFLAELWITKFQSANPRVRRSSRIMEKPVSPVPKIIAASKAQMEPPKKKVVKKHLATTTTVVEIVDDSESENVVVTSAVSSSQLISVFTKELWKARFESSFSQAFYKEDPSGNR